MTYDQTVTIAGSASAVMTAVSTIDGLRTWWSPIVTGSMEPGGEFAIGFEGLDETIGLVALKAPGVVWRVRYHSNDPSWNDSTIRFTVQGEESACELTVQHEGVPAYRVAEGWQWFLESIRQFVEQGRGMPYRAQHPAVDIALAYHRAWTAGDYEAAVALLADDLRTEVPINSYGNRSEWKSALIAFGNSVKQTKMVTCLGDATEAILIYDMDVTSLGMLRIAENFTVSKGRITGIRHVHDTYAMRQPA